MPKSLEVALDDMSVPAAHFDVRAYADSAQASYRDDLNLEAYEAAPLTPETLRTLRYLQVVERGTMTHLRSVLVTATHKDSRVTAFLITWAFEKYWIADALDQIIRAHDGADADRAPFRTPVERTIRESIVANIVGLPMIAVHTSLGTLDEWLMQAAFSPRRRGNWSSSRHRRVTVLPNQSVPKKSPANDSQRRPGPSVPAQNRAPILSSSSNIFSAAHQKPSSTLTNSLIPSTGRPTSTS